MVVGHLCGRYGRKSNPATVDVITRIKACSSITKVRRFLGGCVFYQFWIPNFAHIAILMYNLLRKGIKFRWGQKQELAMESLKKVLKLPPILRQIDYNCDRPVAITIDTSPIAIGWVLVKMM